MSRRPCLFQGIVAPDAVSEVSVDSGLTTSSVRASEQDLTGFPDPSADRRQRSQLLSTSPSKPVGPPANADSAATEDDQRSELFGARKKPKPAQQAPAARAAAKPVPAVPNGRAQRSEAPAPAAVPVSQPLVSAPAPATAPVKVTAG